MSERKAANNRAKATDGYAEAKLATAEQINKEVEKRKKVLNKAIEAAFRTAAEAYLKSIGIKTFKINSTPGSYAWSLYGRRAFSETRCRGTVRGMELTFHVNLPKRTKAKFIKAMAEVTEMEEKAKGWRRGSRPNMTQHRRDLLQRVFKRNPLAAALLAKKVDAMIKEEQEIINKEREALKAAGVWPVKRPRR
jgi:hypothetical protein